MSLLREIQDGASVRSTPLADLLRKSKILAKRLGHEPLSSWADKELNGYSAAEELPEYRIIHPEVKGYFAGPFGSQMENVPIPPLSVPAELRESLFTHRFWEGVAHYEALLSSGGHTFNAPWPANALALHGGKIIAGYTCFQAVQVIGRGAIEGMLDQVRNRILTFALEIEEANPDAGEARIGEEPVPAQKVDQIFNTYILGGMNVVASGSHNVIRDFEQSTRDWESLVTALKTLGLPEQDIEDLRVAVDEDRENADEGVPGRSVQGWLDRLRERMTGGAIKLSAGVAASTIAALVVEFIKTQS